MAYEELLKSVEESALEKERELKEKASAAAGDIRSRAKVQAEAIRKGHLVEAEKAADAERNKQIYLTNAENKELLIRVREEAFEKAFSLAAARLFRLREDPKYPVIFSRLLNEAAGAIGEDHFIIHIDPRDEALCRNTLAALKIEAGISTDIRTSGGVVASLADGSVALSNTFESRLMRVREHRQKEIHTILLGE